jgi:hypothetical protein
MKIFHPKGADRHNYRHGEARGAAGAATREYRSWQSMKRRCLNSRDDAYKNYGGNYS